MTHTHTYVPTAYIYTWSRQRRVGLWLAVQCIRRWNETEDDELRGGAGDWYICCSWQLINDWFPSSASICGQSINWPERRRRRRRRLSIFSTTRSLIQLVYTATDAAAQQIQLAPANVDAHLHTILYAVGFRVPSVSRHTSSEITVHLPTLSGPPVAAAAATLPGRAATLRRSPRILGAYTRKMRACKGLT